MTDWQVRTGSLADLDVVGPLWVAVHHRHAETMPQLAGEVAVGYGLAHVLTVDETWIPDTWETDSRIGEIESLSVLPEYRGSGLGSELLERLEQHLHAIGVKDLILGALPGNTDAIRLYERRGYQPTWLYLSRFQGRN